MTHRLKRRATHRLVKPSEIEKLKTTPLIVCCANGMRSGTAVSALKKAGFEQVFMLSGGIAAWTEANLPLTKK